MLRATPTARDATIAATCGCRQAPADSSYVREEALKNQIEALSLVMAIEGEKKKV